MLRYFLSFALTLTMTVALPSALQAAEGEDWLELTSENFVLYTDADRERAEKLIRNLERYHITVGTLVGLDFSVMDTPPLRVFAYSRQRDYVRRYDMRGTGGFYTTQAEGPVTILSLEDGDKAWELKGQQVLYHEYTHHLLHKYSPYEYPRWYDEGFAEYMATIEFEDDIAIIGNPPIHRLPALKRAGDWLSIRELVSSRGEYLGYMGTGLTRDPDRHRYGGMHQYAQGWLLTHFLYNSETYRDGLAPYLSAINEPGADEEAAFEEAFGVDYWDMGRDVSEYWYKYELPLQSVDLGEIMPSVDVGIRELGPVEAIAIDYEGRLLSGRLDGDEDAAVIAFKAMIDAGLRETRMREYMARIAISEQDWDTANDQLEAILDARPSHAPALTLLAELMRATTDAESLDAATIKNMRKTCIRAIKANPTYVPALLAFAKLDLIEGQTVGSMTLKILDSIAFLAPDLESGGSLRARLLAKAGRIDEARAIVQKMIDWSHSRSARREYEDLLETVEAMAAETEQG